MAAYGALGSASHRSPSFAAWRHLIERRTVQWQRPGPGATARGRLREIASGISQLRHPLWKLLQGQPRWPEWLPWRDGRTQSLPERA